MGTITRGTTYGSTETITNAKLHLLVDDATVTGIVNADVSAGAAIAASKLDLTSSGYLTTGAAFTITGVYTYSTAPVFSVSPTFTVAPNLPADTVDAITEIKSTLKSGADATLITGTKGTANNLAKWNADGDLVDLSGYIPDDSVDTTALKTTTGAISSTTYVGENDTLPGGEYGFYPQIKMSDTTSGQWQSTIVGNKYNQMSFAGWTTYATKITLSSLNGKTMYAQQRYVTASGTDQWIFLKIDKNTKEILSAWQAPDHPSYGNGGDAEKLPHPFGSYDETKHEIILLNKETCKQLQEKATRERDILTLVHEEYKPDMAEKETYQPLHSGKFLEQKPVLIETIPDYISVRKLIKRSK